MEIHKGCTYWYEVSMHVNKKGDGYHVPAKVRIPVACISPNTDESICRFLNPSSAEFETRIIRNELLFEDPIPTQKQLSDLQESLKASQEEKEQLKRDLADRELKISRIEKHRDFLKSELSRLSNELEGCRAEKAKT